MNRLFLLMVSALALAALALPATAAAKLDTRTCGATSAAVVGGKIVAKLESSNVDPSQARFATCKRAKKVINRTVELGVEMPRTVHAFYCRPTVSGKAQNVVSYRCVFRGADTPTFVRLTFKVTYKPA